LLAHRVTKLAEGAAAVAAVREAQVEDLNKVTAATNYRKKRQIQDKRVVKTGCTATAEDALLRVAKRAVKDKKAGVVHKSMRDMRALRAEEDAASQVEDN
jgi:hypothetical protein